MHGGCGWAQGPALLWFDRAGLMACGPQEPVAEKPRPSGWYEGSELGSWCLGPSV